MSMDIDEQHLYSFPPFPTPPAGVTIVPFSAFVPAGYKRATGSSGEPIEVDASMGIPTVRVLNEHEAAVRRKAKKKRRVAGNALNAEGQPIPWWHEWEAGEATRAMSVPFLGSHIPLEDRVCLAADDFRVGRTWPEVAQGVRLMWDQFRLYIGLLSSIPLYKKVKRQKGQVDGPNEGADASEEDDDIPKATQVKVDIVQDYLEQTPHPGKLLEPGPDESSPEGQRLRAFLDDMEKTVKVFLSSYMRDTGLIWTEKNLFIAPTVLHFFLRFMLRNAVFADSKEHLDSLKKAVAIAAAAQKELPLTAKHGQILPGRVDIGCRECWGTQGSLSIQISATLPPANGTPADGVSTPGDTSSAFETELKQNNVAVVPSDIVLDSITAKQVLQDNLDVDPGTTIHVVGDPWMTAIQGEEDTTASWTDVSVPWLMQLLGPSVLPLTMGTGIVEFSTRRIRNVIAPKTNSETGTREASAVEEVLGDMFYKVVMAPWVGSDAEETADFPRPVIVAGSRAAAAAEAGGTIGRVDHGDEGAWNPYRDEVTVLVDEAAVKALLVGMGLCGTWVEMVPEGEARGRYWYVENLVASFPSYYTEGSALELPDGEDIIDEDM